MFVRTCTSSRKIEFVVQIPRRSIAVLANDIFFISYVALSMQGKLVGFRGELIHVFNKNESAVHESDYFENLSHRDNIVLLGDSLGMCHRCIFNVVVQCYRSIMLMVNYYRGQAR